MEDEQRQAAKEHMIALMQAGHSQAGKQPQEQVSKQADWQPIDFSRMPARGEKQRSRMEGMGIQPNCGIPYFNGWLRLVAHTHRCQAVKCRRRYKSSSASLSVLGISIVSAPNGVWGSVSGVRKKTAPVLSSTGSSVARGCWCLTAGRDSARDRIDFHRPFQTKVQVVAQPVGKGSQHVRN